MKVQIRREAFAHLDGIFSWIAEDSFVNAERVVDRIFASIGRLAEFPRLGHAGRTVGTLEWAVPGLPYIVVYRIDEARDELTVVAIFHGAQDR